MIFSQLHTSLPRRSLLIAATILLLLSFVSSYYFKVLPSVNIQQKALQRYITEQERDAAALMKDSSLMRRLVLKSESLSEFNRVAGKQYGLFLFAEGPPDHHDLLFWNTQHILPPGADFSLGDGAYFQHLANGYYVMRKTTLRLPGTNDLVAAYVLIPILSQYYLQTDYLLTRFVYDPDAGKIIALADGPTSYPIRSAGQTLFYIKGATHSHVQTLDAVTIFLRVAALIFLLVFIHLVSEAITRRRRALYGVLFFGASLFVLRYVLFHFEAIFSFRQFELFNPNIYGANDINPSLGDLLINAIFTCWLVLYAWFNVGPVQKTPAFFRGRWRYAGGVACFFILIFTTFQLANVVHSLVADSRISFNVTNFFGLDGYTVIGLIVLALLSLTYYYFSRLLFRYIFPAFDNRYLFVYLALVVTGLSYLTLRSGNTIVLFHLPVLLWFLVYTFLVSQENFIINRFRITVAGVLFWIFVFSVSLAAIILQGNRENELRIRRGIAEKYDQITDPSNDRTLSIAITYLDNRFLLNNFQRFENPEQNRVLRDSILRQNFTGYSTRYDTRIYVFDSANHGVHNDDAKGYPELNTLFTVQSKSTGIPDLNYLESSFDRLTYITRRIIRDSTHAIGTFFLISTPRQYANTDAVYPELFRQVSRRDDAENSPVYSYAIYSNKLLISYSSKYQFQTTLSKSQVPKSEFELRNNGENSELWYKANSRKIVVVAKTRDSLIESITLFSYLFCAFLFMVGLLQVFALIIRLFSDWRSFHPFGGMSIRAQIHGTVIFISILSFLIIGAATISFFISRYNRNNVDRLSRTAGIMVRELQKRLSDTADFKPSLSDSASRYNLQRLVNEVADIHDADVNVYDLAGNLQVSSEDDIYEKGILSTKMHPLAYYHLDRLRQVQHVQKETLSSLEYWSIYSAVRNDQGQVVKYLNIPYFSSQIDLKQEISNFLVTIINLNAFIFLIAGAIALFITNRITRSFSVIGEKMRDITLGKNNDEIVWNKRDEIGDLVKQYNKMVHQLEESAEALAKSEREGAWREMARQVAHEIKNPLTPMKLSIQYLQRASAGGQDNIKELTSSVANTLIEQIDHLSKIAADFSQFANIGNRRIELVDLHQVIGILVDLYGSNPKVSITWNKIPGSIVMKADKTQMNRMFTNLIANAVDACMASEACLLTIDEKQEDNVVTISVTDNGEGIPEAMHSKIFMPNFTTKTSGTGLGLAMSKSIVEQAGGHIWFETEQGQGTTFFVSLPVIS